MKEKIKTQKGFVQIPLLIAVIIGMVIIGGGSYFGYTQFKTYQAKQVEKEKQTQELFEVQQKSLEEARKEIEGLKEQQDIQSKQLETEKEIDTNLTNAEIITKIKPAVVYVETSYGSGSGIIIDRNGYILTNAHVVRGETSIKIYLSNNQSFVVKKITIDENSDLALLKIDANNLPIVEFGDSDKVQQGDEVFTFGYPFGIKGDVSFKEGTISRRVTEKGVTYIETSAEIHPGNSGGPLVDRLGKVIGINTAKFGDSIKGIILGESIKLAIPIKIASNLIPDLKLNERDVSAFASNCNFKKAKGFITVFSALDIPQKMIASTRFVSPSGLIFRIDENILVAAATVVNNKVIPGQVTVSVTANEIGEEYKIGPTTFSIPGFAGTEKYTKLYGKSDRSMSCD